jgi:hypothetical protein
MYYARLGGLPPALDPARGCIEGIELFKFLHSAIVALAPCPVSHLHFPALFFLCSGGIVPQINQVYK